MDTTERRYTKAELLQAIGATWTALTAALDRLTPAQMTDIRDPQGWSAQDHLIHLAAWERSVVVFLQGRPRHLGLGVPEGVYESGDDDTINAAIQQQHQQRPVAEVVAELRAVHAQLLDLLAPLSDADLYRANSTYQPAGTAADDRPVIGLIFSNTAQHFQEHLAWITSLVAARSPPPPAAI